MSIYRVDNLDDMLKAITAIKEMTDEHKKLDDQKDELVEKLITEGNAEKDVIKSKLQTIDEDSKYLKKETLQILKNLKNFAAKSKEDNFVQKNTQDIEQLSGQMQYLEANLDGLDKEVHENKVYLENVDWSNRELSCELEILKQEFSKFKMEFCQDKQRAKPRNEERIIETEKENHEAGIQNSQQVSKQLCDAIISHSAERLEVSPGEIAFQSRTLSQLDPSYIKKAKEVLGCKNELCLRAFHDADKKTKQIREVQDLVQQLVYRQKEDEHDHQEALQKLKELYKISEDNLAQVKQDNEILRASIELLNKDLKNND